MRARAIREGSVGLLILLAIGLFGVLVLWLRGLNPGSRSYQLTVEFKDTSGMQVGTAVRYRGVPVGRVVAINPSSNAVEVKIEITQTDLVIPGEVAVSANQAGLIGETSIDITPLRELQETELALRPTANDCDSTQIICNGDRLIGDSGASYDGLIRSAQRLAETFDDPELLADIKTILNNTTQITSNVIRLTDELTQLTKDTRQEIAPLAASARRATDKAGDAAEQIELTASQVNNLLASNRSTLVSTLDNVNASSVRLRQIMDTLGPAIQEGEFLENLETLSANASEASANLRDITAAFNTPTNLMLLQQTLESARDVFQSAQKIMADVDELTGDPAFRTNLRNLVNGLSGLVSTTQDLEQQTQLAELLTPSQPEAPVRLALTAEPETAPPDNSMVLTYNGKQYRIVPSSSTNSPKPSEPQATPTDTDKPHSSAPAVAQ